MAMPNRKHPNGIVLSSQPYLPAHKKLPISNLLSLVLQSLRHLEEEEEKRQAAEMEAARLKGLEEDAQKEKAKQEAIKLAALALNKQIQHQEQLKKQQFRQKKKGKKRR
ncbi:hypothetical protein SK128_006696 [Halocaridina rubra]|uniref:Uncharacterized protein n=1 Tax=Halocaridina rubra TaxID=373956 RepID=A0AAN8WKD5_HALRR